jgi:RNA polymerase sigma-70 factor, ECF subfamily
MTRGHTEITGLLKGWARGDEAALEELIPVVYQELRRAAARYTLQPTALVNEVYLRLVNLHDVTWHDRAHFFAVAAQLMRRILVDAARRRASVKRGGRARRVDHSSAFDFDQLPDAASIRDRELMDIDDALRRLSNLDARKARVIELRFFGGLSVDETAEALKVSPQTVMRDWKLARAWMTRELSKR